MIALLSYFQTTQSDVGWALCIYWVGVFRIRSLRMTQTKIHLITNMQGITLMVFYTEAKAWQFRVLSAGGAVFGEQKLYYTAEAAEKAGREWIAQDFGL